MSIKEKAKELAAGAMLITAVTTGSGCTERAYDGVDGPDYCVWSDWNNPHCGECKETICEDGICEDVPCGSRNKGNSESEQERTEEEQARNQMYCPSDLVEAMEKLGMKCDPYNPVDSWEAYRIMKASGIWCDNPDDENVITRCDTLEERKKQIKETQKKSELKSTEPKDICLDNYLGARYKKGVCEIPFSGNINKLEDLANKKHLQNCQMNGIKKGKGTTATVDAVCKGVKAKINLKRFQAQQRNSKNR